MFVHHLEMRTRRALRMTAMCSVLSLSACGDSTDEARRAAALANDTTTLDSGAVRQPIPAGIDPAMVEWRSDGALIASRDSLLKTPGYVIDSVFPPEEALRRFQAEAGGVPVTALSDGEKSVEALVQRYWRTLVRGDSLALTPLVVNKAEFAYLYFPESDEPANGMQPHVSWLLLANNGGRGLARALESARGSDSSATVTVVCSREARALGANRLHGPCGVVRPGVRDTLWLAAHILERDGTFKLMSFANEL